MMLHFMNQICPDSPYMIERFEVKGGGEGEGIGGEEMKALRWLLKMLGEVEEFYDCIGGMIGSGIKTDSLNVSPTLLGFSVNMLTLILLVLLAFSHPTSNRRRSISSLKYVPAKILLQLVPANGACIGFIDLVLLLWKLSYGFPTLYHEWLFKVSQFLLWVCMLLVLRTHSWIVCFNRILCIWWIIKPIFLIPYLQIVFSSSQVLECFMESLKVLLDVIFGFLITTISVKWSYSDSSSVEESLLPCKIDHEEQPREYEFIRKFWHLMTFKSIDSVMERGAKKQLEFEDLLELPDDMDPISCHNILHNCWKSQQQKNISHASLFKAICYAFGWPYFRLGLLKVVNDGLGFVGPLILNKLIRFLQQGSTSFDGYILALSLGMTSIFKSFLDTQYTFRLSKLKLKLRSSIMTAIYKKCLGVKLADRSKFSEGEIQTFMSVDADRTINLCNSFHDVWSLPLQIGVALYLLYTQVKFAFVAGVAITILLIPVNKWIATLIANATKKMMEQKDERIRRSAELLTHIRTLKMYSWELLFSGWLMKTRSLEVTYLSTRKYLDAWCVFFWATTPTLFSLCTFGLYTLMGHQLDAATVFTCLALFNNLISPLNSFPWVINGLIDAIISTRRLSNYLACPEHETKQEQGVCKESNFEAMAIVIQNASCSWSNSDQENFSLILDSVNVLVPTGSLVAVIGEVGSGKSSLLNLILGEMRLVSGSTQSCGSTAYVPQVPWILSGTIRDNILFGRDYELGRYSAVLKACELEHDLSLMIGGDMAFIGEKGINLSGGQKARLALARAIYSRSDDIYLLDDVLSAVDAHVAHSILHNAILGPLINQQTRILCTHNIQAISAADIVIVMEKGHVKWLGCPVDLCVSAYSTFLSVDDDKFSSETQDQSIISELSNEAQQEVVEGDSITVSHEIEKIEEELRKEGRVESTVYKNYVTFCGRGITILICLSAFFMQASRNGNDLWLSYWVDTTGRNQKKNSATFYLVVLGFFCLVNSLLTLIRSFSFAFGGLKAAVQVHDLLLKKLVSASVSFYDQTPSGRILNRFSSDLYTIDDSLPFILNILLANFVGLLGIAIVLSYVQVMFLLLLLPFWFIYSKLQFFYRLTSRELRRLDSVSRSPIYASFTETLDGSSTIRAFKLENFFVDKFMQHIVFYQRTSFSEVKASLWLSLRLQLLAAFIVSFVALMAVLGSHGHIPLYLGTPGLVGLALSYAAPVVALLGSFLSSFTETEKEMVSVERVLQYMEIPQEELTEGHILDAFWPSKGEIQFRNVTLRYKPSSPAALNDVSFTIPGGTNVGIVGRTGAGKSSVLNAIFRLNPICRGHIHVDGMDIAGICLRHLRSHISIVPQSPFLFEGSLRANLDPFEVSDDAHMWIVLEKCHMKEEVEAAGGLDIRLKDSGSSFSVGQRQLLCLARSLLRSSKILCLDECTANIDTQTASKLQKVIDIECQGITVLTIAHRISTVVNMDNIFVLDQGRVVEQGNPQLLLNNNSSWFSGFAKASNM